VNLEKKLGIHASPTCVMSFGDNGDCVGYLIGEENRGMRYMFTMMNDARLTMAAQSIGIASRAYQRALSFSMERKQGRLPTTPANQQDAIIVHADVRRMLMTMKSELEAMRTLTYLNAAAMDRADTHPDEDVRVDSQALVDLLIPMAKSWCTDLGGEIASLGVQIHGGMGFIEETGAAQHMRDARIGPIYEGTNGIHAMDLLTRKLPMKGGDVVRKLLDDIRALNDELKETDNSDLEIIRASLSEAVEVVSDTSEWLLENLQSPAQTAAAGCAPYLRMFSVTVGGYLLAKGALAATNLLADNDAEADYLKAKIQTARFYSEHIMSQVPGLKATVVAGESSMFAVSPEWL
ncbi:MAG: acyl-CoA dehydrogenase, partial [Pseudomonadota bacterium]